MQRSPREPLQNRLRRLWVAGEHAGGPPELFAAPVLQQVLERCRNSLVTVSYFDGLMVGDPDPLVESFAGEPEVHDPVRGRIKGVAAFRAF